MEEEKERREEKRPTGRRNGTANYSKFVCSCILCVFVCST